MSKGALEDLLILDLTRVLAGPYATMILADMGANVIKIEVPGKGDDTRSYAPFIQEESMYYANFNRNKKGMTLNLKSEKGKEIFRQLVKDADVVVENYRPGVMDRLGLGYEDLKKINEGIIYAEVSGFGSYGPYSQRAGYDIISQAMGGLMSITGPQDGAPTRAGNAMGDILGGLNLTIGILAAVHARTLTGKGQKVDVALVDCVVSSLEAAFQRYFKSGDIPKRMGNRYAAVAPYDSYRAKDGYFVLGCGNQKFYEILCKDIMHQPELIQDQRFLTLQDRVENHEELTPIIEAYTTKYSVDENVDTLMQWGIPAAPIYDLKQISEDVHIANAREMFVSLHHPIIGEMKVSGCPIKLMDTKPQIKTAAPTFGQDNEEILNSIGYDHLDIEQFSTEHII